MSGPPEHIQDVAKTAVDATAVGVAGLTWLEIMPNVAAVLSIIWFALRIFESDTVQKLISKKP